MAMMGASPPAVQTVDLLSAIFKFFNNPAEGILEVRQQVEDLQKSSASAVAALESAKAELDAARKAAQEQQDAALKELESLDVVKKSFSELQSTLEKDKSEFESLKTRHDYNHIEKMQKLADREAAIAVEEERLVNETAAAAALIVKYNKLVDEIGKDREIVLRKQQSLADVITATENTKADYESRLAKLRELTA